MERQQALRKPAAARVGELTGTQAWANDAAQGPEWAMGIPVQAGAQGVAGVICPVASRIEGTVRAGLAPLLLLVASQAEADRIAKIAEPGQRIEGAGRRHAATPTDAPGSPGRQLAAFDQPTDAGDVEPDRLPSGRQSTSAHAASTAAGRPRGLTCACHGHVLRYRSSPAEVLPVIAASAVLPVAA